MQEWTIATHDLSRRFGMLTAVDHLNLRVPKSSIYGFLGPNGSGKTTTIRLLLGLLNPTQGEIFLFHQPLQKNRLALLSQVGALVENPTLYPHLTGYENLELTRRLIGGSEVQIDRALTIVKLQESAKRLVNQYSLGMRQRLGIAMALMSVPDLLILDEPTNGLDPAGIHEMRELICTLPREHGITVFLSSHLLNEVEQMATHIGIVQKGHLIFQGTPGELQAQLEDYVSLGVDQPEKAERMLSNAGWNVRRHVNGVDRLVVKINGSSDAALVNSQLVKSGVNVFHLTVNQPSLEEIFLKLTDNKSIE